MNGGFPKSCPYSDCPSTRLQPLLSPVSAHIVRKGKYWRADDSKWVSRFTCLRCRRSFSSSRLTPCFGQKKRKLNPGVLKLLVSGVSIRRTARLLRINPKTVDRKLLFHARQARMAQDEFLSSLRLSPEKLPAFQFDEMETFERSKCLPLSIALAVLPGSRKILGFQVGRMPAAGPLAAISRKKYGKRKDERAQKADLLFCEIAPLVSASAEISTDQNPKYPGWLRPHFPQAVHRAFKGQRGCVTGQGEMKKVVFDPLFALNHTAAMFRANVNRLFRRTWCTTKRIDRLEAHLWLYVRYHNQVLT